MPSVGKNWFFFRESRASPKGGLEGRGIFLEMTYPNPPGVFCFVNIGPKRFSTVISIGMARRWGDLSDDGQAIPAPVKVSGGAFLVGKFGN